MRWIDFIFIHCSAGYGTIESIKKFWKDKLKWKSPGYHIIVDLEGKVISIHPIGRPSNGVKGKNANSVHISYIGGVDPSDYSKAMDSRTDKQKAGILDAIQNVLAEISQYQEISHIKILGHRDASPDQNGDGVISAWERIKECPSFDAIEEYAGVVECHCS